MHVHSAATALMYRAQDIIFRWLPRWGLARDKRRSRADLECRRRQAHVDQHQAEQAAQAVHRSLLCKLVRLLNAGY